jgi:long-chain acyl-CoA synthetase
MQIAKLLELNVKKYSDKPAIIFKGQAITFSQLRDVSLKLAEGLMCLGLKKGDKVAIYLPNCPEYIYSYLAIWSLGLVAVPLDFMLTQEELISCLAHSETAALIVKLKPAISLPALKEKCN